MILPEGIAAIVTGFSKIKFLKYPFRKRCPCIFNFFGFGNPCGYGIKSGDFSIMHIRRASLRFTTHIIKPISPAFNITNDTKRAIGCCKC